MKHLFRSFLPVWALLLSGMTSYAEEIRGRVVDNGTSEPLIGATVQIVSENKAAICDIDGFFRIEGLAKGRYTLLVKYVTYEDMQLEDVTTANENTEEGILIEMTGLAELLGSSSVVATRVTNTELSAIY